MTLASRLKPHVATIEAAAAAGDQGAKQIIDLYQMHVRLPSDPGAPALCAAAFDDWLRKRSPYVAGEATREPPFNPNARER